MALGVNEIMNSVNVNGHKPAQTGVMEAKNAIVTVVVEHHLSDLDVCGSLDAIPSHLLLITIIHRPQS